MSILSIGDKPAIIQQQSIPTSNDDIPIDPALFAIEQIVNDARKGKVRMYADEDARPVEPASTLAETVGEDNEGENGQHVIGLMDDEFDPALREIVNSLTNAQQSSSMMGTNLTPAQAQAAIDAHLSEEHDHSMALKTFEDLERAGYGMMDDQFGGHNDSFLLPDHEAGPSSSYNPQNAHDAEAEGSKPDQPISKRGRPKGSRNKPKPGRPSPPPPPPKNVKPRGRPPKKRTPEEQAEMDRRKAEKEQGIKRGKGRPRKYPGYLVREMRLKKNRAEYRELLNRYDDDGGQDHGHHQDHDHHQLDAHGHDHEGMDVDVDMAGQGQREEGDGGGFWSENMERSILAAVEGLDGNGLQGQDQEDVPSSRAFQEGGDMEMRRVFGLAEHDEPQAE